MRIKQGCCDYRRVFWQLRATQKKLATTKTNTAHTHRAVCSHTRLMLETGYALVCEYQLPEISAFNKIASTIVWPRGYYLPESVFGHCHLYTVPTRGNHQINMVYGRNKQYQGQALLDDCIFMKNAVICYWTNAKRKFLFHIMCFNLLQQKMWTFM